MPLPMGGMQALKAATRLNYLIDGRTAIRLLPPIRVAGPDAIRAAWSPDGRFALAACVSSGMQPTLATPASLTLWDKTTRRSLEIWRHRLASPVLAGPMRWLANAQVGIVRWRWMEADENSNWGIKEGIVWVNAAQGVARELDSQPGDELFAPLTQAGCVILHGKPGFALQSLNVVAPDGSLSAIIAMPDGARSCKQMCWQAEGKQFCMELEVAATAQDKKDNAKAEGQAGDGPNRSRWFAIDVTQGRVSLLDKEPKGIPALRDSIAFLGVPSVTDGGALRVKSAATILKHGSVEAEIHPLWLETGGTKPMPALLCADGEQGRVAPSGDAALYLAQGSVWVTPLQRMPRALFCNCRPRAASKRLKYRAWTLGQAVRMWSAAHKGMLPMPEQALAALQSLMPSESLYAGFRYVWTGGALPANARPTETVVAEIIGPGGKAVIFADGHSAWKNSE